MTKIELVNTLLKEALEEEEREGGQFDSDGWGNFFIEDWEKNPEAVEEAWKAYQNHHWVKRNYNK